jgi:hypothetical protein
LSGALQVQITRLFTPNNFCFLTSSGGRTPTFYFARGGLANLTTAMSCGRLRTMHPHGPLMDITNSRKGHFFFQNLADRQTVRHVMGRLSPVQRTNGDGRFILELVGNVYRTTPQNGDYHYEVTFPGGSPNHITRRHASGGTVQLNPRPNQQQVVRLIDRLLTDNCAIKINNNILHPLGVAPVAHPVIVAAAAYLNSL